MLSFAGDGRVMNNNVFFFYTIKMLRRGIGINDVDSTTGMTMLHYAIRASALAGKTG